MTTGEKIYRLRRQLNLTQEQLADLLNVTRQAISRWEGDISLPESDKLLSLSKVLNCSVDDLLNDNELNNREENNQSKKEIYNILRSFSFNYEYVSKKKIGNIPLVHINVGFGKVAKGIIAIGYRSIGLISIGLISIGILSIGVLALGIIALGVMALGLLSGGSLSIGLISFGAISIGLLSVGAISVGEFSIGALSIGKYFAYGDNSQAMVALGATSAKGSEYYYCSGVQNDISGFDHDLVKSILNEKVPSILKFLCDFALLIAGI